MSIEGAIPGQSVSSKVSSTNGKRDGMASDNYDLTGAVSHAPPTNIWQLFGDADGDVDTVDFAAFRLGLGGTTVLTQLDHDHDNDVDISDFGQFRLRSDLFT